jgi:hypothetical protein
MTDFDYYFNKLERFRAIDKKVNNYKMSNFTYPFRKLDRFRAVEKKVYNYKMV